MTRRAAACPGPRAGARQAPPEPDLPDAMALAHDPDALAAKVARQARTLERYDAWRRRLLDAVADGELDRLPALIREPL